MKKLFQIITFCLSAIIIPACAGKADTKFTNLSADEFERLINDSEVQCVDVRTATEYSEEHIAGSLNINVLDQHFLDDAEKQLEHNRPVAVYCRSGRRSRNAAERLSEKGYTVFNLDKGFEEWKEAGKNTEK